MSVSVRAQLLLTRQKLSMGLKATPSPTCSPSFPHSNRSYLTKSRQPGLRIQGKTPIYAPEREFADGAASPRAPGEWPITSSGPL